VSGLLERGREAFERSQTEYDSGQLRNESRGVHEVLRRWVFAFYENTLSPANTAANRRTTDATPWPDVQVEGVGSLGGGYHHGRYTWEHEGIRWLARYEYRMESWSTVFFVRCRTGFLGRKREWVQVHSPRSVYELQDRLA
jgi:hypothetical protein